MAPRMAPQDDENMVDIQSMVLVSESVFAVPIYHTVQFGGIGHDWLGWQRQCHVKKRKRNNF